MTGTMKGVAGFVVVGPHGILPFTFHDARAEVVKMAEAIVVLNRYRAATVRICAAAIIRLGDDQETRLPKARRVALDARVRKLRAATSQSSQKPQGGGRRQQKKTGGST